MKAALFTMAIMAIALVASKAMANDALTRDEIEKLPFMAALAYAEAIDAYCLPEWHYASTALAAAATAQAALQNKPYIGAEQTLEATLIKGDKSACEPAKAFVDKVTATIPEIQPRMDATLAALKKEEAERDAVQARAKRISECGHVVATVKVFLAAGWSLANGRYEEELPGCIAELATMPEAEDLLAEAKTVLPQMTERLKVQSASARNTPEQGQSDPQKIISDWCAKQTQKTAMCDETAK
ncbi:hypothetical protein SAZ10_11605 [Mesorhizobium sp. BAC0120]|uniref:hypothetical protein n=1 Tax=Mesorhizobium sp. BAC0120 TaxID=3090670 RepID=UPI00298C12CF|nr:hypothetical protein [Mesorhizobium sp. BAC0120]MDW6022399.1 hypothetical protein [Mesorhizobium sp. BAC0120]